MALATPTDVVLELMTMGQQSAMHLGELLRATTSPGEHQTLTAEILRCCERVIAALRSGVTATGKKRKVTDRGSATTTCPLTVVPSKRRARGAEVADREVDSITTADGFEWRKYGQKYINGCKHPRTYYRCAYRGQGCGASRRVQRSRDEPAAFAIAYYGKHTCGCSGGVACQGGLLIQPPTVVDSAVVGADRSRVSPPALLPSEQSAGHDVQLGPSNTSRGWPSSSSSSSEVDFGVSPVLEFLEGRYDWESVVNYYLGSADLPRIGTLQ